MNAAMRDMNRDAEPVVVPKPNDTRPSAVRRVWRRLARWLSPSRRLAAALKPVVDEQRSMQRAIRQMRADLHHIRYFQHEDSIATLATMDLALAATRQEVDDFLLPRQLDYLQTLERVRRDRMSLARLGDGEFRLMLHPSMKLYFQPNSARLAQELKNVLTLDGYDPARLLVAISDPQHGDRWWDGFWSQVWRLLRPLLDADRQYGSAMVSRSICFTYHGAEAVTAWRSIWEGRDVCFVTGRGSRFEAIPQLFSNTRSQDWVYSEPVNAFADLPRLIPEIEARVSRETLCLIALGPAGTILAAKLSALGYQALDIGHISNCYLEAFEGGKKPERTAIVRELGKVPGKPA